MDTQQLKQQYLFLKRVSQCANVSYDDETCMFTIDGDIIWDDAKQLHETFDCFPVPLYSVEGRFSIRNNPYITSLKNCPRSVSSLHLENLPALTDFENVPTVHRNMMFINLPHLNSLEHLRQFKVENLTITHCGITSLCGCPNIISDCLTLTSNHKLKSLKTGSPIEIATGFNCSFSGLECLDHDGITFLGRSIIMRGMPKLKDCKGLYSIKMDINTTVLIEGSEEVKKDFEIWKKMKLFCDF